MNVGGMAGHNNLWRHLPAEAHGRTSAKNAKMMRHKKKHRFVALVT